MPRDLTEAELDEEYRMEELQASGDLEDQLDVLLDGSLDKELGL